MAEKKKCPSGKIRNPETKRCVDKDGKIGRSLVAKKAAKKAADTKETTTKKTTATTKSTAKPVVASKKTTTSGKMKESAAQVVKILIPYVGLVKGARLASFYKDQEFSIIHDGKDKFKFIHFDGVNIVEKQKGLDKAAALAKIVNHNSESVDLVIDRLNANKAMLKVW